MDLLVSVVIYTQAPPLAESTLAFTVQTHQNVAYKPPKDGDRGDMPDRKRGGGTRT